MRSCVLLLAALLLTAVSTAQAALITLQVVGTTDATTPILGSNPPGFDVVFPGGNWTPTFNLIPNNVGLTTSTSLFFNGGSGTQVQTNVLIPFV
jgi:hypothetical protein